MNTKRQIVILIVKGDEAVDYDVWYSNEREAKKKALDLSLSHHTETRVVKNWGYDNENTLARFFQGCAIAA